MPIIKQDQKHAFRYVKNGWKYQRRVTSMMVEDMLFNPILAVKVLLGEKVPPHMELRLMSVWSAYMTSDDSGISTGKTMTHAMVSAIRSIIMPDRVSGIISATFKQSQLIFEYYDKWYNSSKIFKNQIVHKKGNARLVHGNNLWLAEFTNGSSIRALPPSVSKNSENLRSERWNDLYLDEWTTFGSLSVITKTMIGRVTRPNGGYDDCPVRKNHIHLASTPFFTYHPSYSIIKSINKKIKSGDRSRKRFSCNFTHIPRSEKWSWLVPIETVKTVIDMNPIGVVRSEVGGKWQKGSLSYHDSKDVEDCRSKSQSCLEFPGDKKSSGIYLFAWDTNAGTSEGKDVNRGDDFGLTVMSCDSSFENLKHRSSFRGSGKSLSEINNIIYFCNKTYGPSFGVYDPGGGGTFVKNELKKGEWDFEGKSFVEKRPLGEVMRGDSALSTNILTPFGRSSPLIKMAWGSFSSESALPNLMNNKARSMMESREVELAPEWSGWDSIIENKGDVSEMREFMNSVGYNQISYKKRIMAESDIAVRQLMMVDVERDQAGKPKVNKGGFYTFASKEKKDAAYGMLYCIFLFATLKKLHKSGVNVLEMVGSGSNAVAARPSSVVPELNRRVNYITDDTSGFRVVEN